MIVKEILTWHPVEEKLPDSDTTVIVHAPGADEPVWLGFYDGVYWFSVDGPTYGDEEEIPQKVVAWAEMPQGSSSN